MPDLNEVAVNDQDKEVTLDVLMAFLPAPRQLYIAQRATGVAIATQPTVGELNAALTLLNGAASTWTAVKGDTAIVRYTDHAAVREVWQNDGTSWSLVNTLRDGIDTTFVTATGTIGAVQGDQTSLIYMNKTVSTYTLTPDVGFTFFGIEGVSVFDSTFDLTFSNSGQTIDLGPNESAQFYRDDQGMRLQWRYPQRNVGSSGTGSLTIQDEGVSLGTADTINFVGGDLAATIIGSTVTVTSTPAAGVQQYVHTQGGASALWTVVHSLGTTAIDSVNVWVGGVKVGATVTVVDANTLTIGFSSPQVGSAIVET
jgi:hypothetical protein